MRTMILSFKADVYKRVLSGEKIYEHRKVFPDDNIKAYLYLSQPIKAISGIMYLSNRIDIADLRNEAINDEDMLRRINDYLTHDKYAMEINKFQETNSIPLSRLREEICGFVVPQMYYFIDNTPLLKYLEKNIILSGKEIKHEFDGSNISAIIGG